MNLEHLLHAGLELEKRIARDQVLRRCFSELWKKSDAKRPSGSAPNACRDIKLRLPAELCDLIETTAKLTGKSAAQVVQESFALYWETHVKNSRSVGSGNGE